MQYNLADDGEILNAKHKLAWFIAAAKTIDMKESTNQRTGKQNNAGHLWFQHISDTFNENGMDMQTTLSKRVGLRWTPEAVKECLFKVLAKAMYDKDSTTKLTSKEFSKVAEMLADVIARDYGVTVEYPSQQSLERGE